MLMHGAKEPLGVTSGLVLYLDAANARSYPKSGPTWFDRSGNGNNGTLVNGVGYNGSNYGSLSFDGVDDYISLSNPSLTNQITVEVWVNLSLASPNSIGWILGRESLYRMLYDVNGFYWVCATTTNGWYTAGTAIGASVASQSGIYHVVGTYDGSNNRIYVNGTLRETGSAISGNIATNSGYTYNLFKSDVTFYGVAYGKGNLYSHRLYNRALSAAEIKQNYDAFKGRYGLT